MGDRILFASVAADVVTHYGAWPSAGTLLNAHIHGLVQERCNSSALAGSYIFLALSHHFFSECSDFVISNDFIYFFYQKNMVWLNQYHARSNHVYNRILTWMISTLLETRL